MSVHAGADNFIMSLLSFQTVIAAHSPCREAGRHEQEPDELTDPATSVVSAPRVSFSLSGRACLACGFSYLFSPRGAVSAVPGCGRSAARGFGGRRRGGQGGALLLFSLSVARSHLVSPGGGFSIAPL